MRGILLLGAALVPLAACQSGVTERSEIPRSLQLQTGPTSEEDILSEITPPSDLLSGGVAGAPTPPPTETARGYRFHDHRAADATESFLGDLEAAISRCDRAAYDAARAKWRAEGYRDEAQARRSLSSTAAHADSAAKRDQDGAELARVQSEAPPWPVPCPPETAFAEPAGGLNWAGLSVGGGSVRLPTTGIGFQRPAGEPERYALESADKVDIVRARLETAFDWSGFYPSISLEYGQGDASTRGEIPAESGNVVSDPNPGSASLAANIGAAALAIDTGIVFNALSPSGSSGINIGPRGSQNRTETEFDYWRLQGKIFLPVRSAWVRPFAYADYFRSRTRHDMSFFYEGVGGGFIFRVEQDRRQSIEDQAWGGGFGVLISQPISDRWRVQATGSIGGLYRDSKLRSQEHNQANFGPASDQDFIIDRNRSASGFGATGTLELGLEYAVSPRLVFGAGAYITSLAEVGGVYNPESGDEVFFDGREVDLRPGRATLWGGQVALRYRLGGPPPPP